MRHSVGEAPSGIAGLMPELAWVPAVEAETNLPAGDGDGGDQVRADVVEISELRVKEHQKRRDETAGDRQKISHAYKALAHAAFVDWKRLTATHAEADELVREMIDRYWREHQESELERAGRVVGAENAEIRAAKAVELAAAKRDRYAKAADMVKACASGLMVGRASDCALSCEWHGVVGCNRICCPLCAPKRAAEEVATYAPVMADLMDSEVWMLSMRNVREGELAEGQTRILEASQKLRRSKWFLDRADSGIQALEVTAGAAPDLLRGDRRTTGWHPHLHMIVGNLNEREHPDGPWDDRNLRRKKLELETAWGRALGVLRHRSGCGARFHSADCSRWRPDRPELGPRTRACGECGAKGELGETERKCGAEDPCDAYRPIVWIDRPHFTEQFHGKPRKVYADDCTDEHDREKALESAARECLKYIVKGVSGIPRRNLPELIEAKERRRWMQSFGGLHEQGMLACPTCETRWRKKDKGEKCPKCSVAGVKPAELEESKPWACEHGHDFTPAGYVVLPWEEWAALNPVGLLIRKRKRASREPPAAQLEIGGKKR